MPSDSHPFAAKLSSHSGQIAKKSHFTPALCAAKNDAERSALQNALTKTDRDIDQLVYQLYALTPEEIALVEGTGTPAATVEAD